MVGGADPLAVDERRHLDAGVVARLVDRHAEGGPGRAPPPLPQRLGLVGRRVARVGRRDDRRPGGPGISSTAGGATSSSRARPSAKRWRTKLSLEVFSSRRRTRYAMPGTSSPTGPYTRSRRPRRLMAACTGSAMPVEQLDLVAVVGHAAVAGVADGVGERAQVVRPEGGAHLAVVVVEEPGAALVVRVGLVLVLEHRRRPPAGPGVHGLGVPVRALHQAHRDRAGPTGRPGDEVGEVVAGVAQVGLDHDAGRHVGELVLGQQVAEQRQREVLGVVVLHVEVHVGVAVAGHPQDRADALLGARRCPRGGSAARSGWPARWA